MQAIDKNKNIEEGRTYFIDKAPVAESNLFLQNDNYVEKITKDKIGGILLYQYNKTFNAKKENNPTIVGILQINILSFPLHRKVELME